MRHTVKAVAAALLAASLSACAADMPYRAPELTKQQLEDCGKACTGRAVDPLTYAPPDGEPVDYLMGYVEFDDQGWFHSPSQRFELYQTLLKAKEKDKDQNFLIVGFAHGWKHNAATDDDNVKSFQVMLERLALIERDAALKSGHKARKVVGVFMGWRGHSLTVPGLDNLTFWTRKDTAERVGGRSIKQLLLDLDELKRALNRDGSEDRLAGPTDTQLVLIGHSFGGLIMYHALNAELMERNRHVVRHGPSYGYGVAKSFGDFVLLVNPAFEGAAYEAMWRAAQDRCYPSRQRPALAVVTSQGDMATGLAFPLGRAYTILQSAPQPGERATVFNTVGHLDRYRTHHLVTIDRGGPRALTRANLAEARQTVAEAGAEAPPVLAPGTSKKQYDGAELVRDGVKGPDYMPYLVISTDTEMIKDHGDIWNIKFLRFMTSFLATEVTRAPAVPEMEPICKAFEPAPAARGALRLTTSR